MPPKRLLFVCTGNICRSPMAEQLARKIASDLGLDVEIRSCGTSPALGSGVTPEAQRALIAMGMPPQEHAPQAASRELLAWADAVLVMTKAHRDRLFSTFPETAGRVFVLREYAGLSGDVDDPYGGSQEDYDRSLASIKEALDRIFKKPSH